LISCTQSFVFSGTALGGTVMGCRVLSGVLRFLAGVLGVFTGVLGGLPADLGGHIDVFNIANIIFFSVINVGPSFIGFIS